ENIKLEIVYIFTHRFLYNSKLIWLIYMQIDNASCVFVADSGRDGQNYFCVGAAPVENRKVVLSEWSESNGSKIENEEGHSPRRWRGNASLSADKNRLQTASTDLRQTDDLLSAGDFDARRSSRGAHNLDAKRSADVARLS